jgi:hypothetical protein
MNKHEKALRWIAEYSPSSYADQIRRRNKALLKELNRPDDERVNFYGNHIGCPHCKGCRDCLWTQACNRFGIDVQSEDESCFDVKFNGVMYRDTRLFRYHYLWYGRIGESYKRSKLAAKCGADRYYKDEQKILHNFLQGHIDWTNNYQWGRYYKQKS